MEYIHIKNLEEYQPQYKDGRRLLWIRWDIGAMRDYKIHKLTPTQKWLFIGLICLETESQKPIPKDLEWLGHQLGIDKTHIPKELLMLQELELVVTNCNGELENPCPTDIHTDIHTDLVTQFFQYFLLKTKKHLKLNSPRRDIISKRLKEGYTLEQLKKAVDNFVLDDWADRHKFIDIVYCIGTRNKVDNLEKWLNWQPKTQAERPKL